MNASELIEEIQKMENRSGSKKRKPYDFGLMKRIVQRLDSFHECSNCKNYMNEFSDLVNELKDDPLTTMNPRLSLLQKSIINHLQKDHKLVMEGYYTGIYMCFGVAIGLSLGTAIATAIHHTTYMSMGLPIGIGIGLAVGAGLDAKAKKDGHVI